MKFVISEQRQPALHQNRGVELLALPVFQGEETAALQNLSVALPNAALEDFKGQVGDLLVHYIDHPNFSRIALLGLGERKLESLENYRQSFAACVKWCQKHHIKELEVALETALSVGSKLNQERAFFSILEGMWLGGYSFHPLKKEDAKACLEQVLFQGKSYPNLFAKAHLLQDAVNQARDLTNHSADLVTPRYLADVALKIADSSPDISLTLLGQKELEEEEMGLMLAVARGSDKEPFLIVLNYQGGGDERTVFLGKGVTFDSGGLNLKPGDSMDTMRCDMAGAAAALSLIQVVSALKLKVNVSVVVAAVENSIDAKSYKPGDTYVGRGKISVEIGNTDAEGRLILADAISYIQDKLSPTRLIDFATLTGACQVALGDEIAGLFCNDDTLANALIRAGESTYERVWRLPLCQEYVKEMRSETADIKSTGGRKGGAIKAALFLEQFVKDLPWAHIDIAGTAFLEGKKRYYGKGATGFGVRLALEFIENLLEDQSCKTH
ncbi:MAG: pepA [Chlamydiales bacterium]|nr:pepA [Chlamydiales bacterium]